MIPKVPLQYYNWANELTKGGDPGVVRRLSELNLKNIDAQIDSQREVANGLSNHPQRERTRRGSAGGPWRRSRRIWRGYRAQKQESQINAARERVERNPTDLTFRFELGEQLVKAGQHSEAVAELQKAQNSPSLGVRAKYLLGQCFEVKNITNLAVKQYEDAKSKLPNMDGMKKDVILPARAALRPHGGQGEVPRQHDRNLRGGFRVPGTWRRASRAGTPEKKRMKDERRAVLPGLDFESFARSWCVFPVNLTW